MSEHKHTPGPWKEWENTKPTADDKQRIQQKASELYDEFREWAEWEACQNGAEYEHMYQRQQVNKKVAELEAERSELRTIEDVAKAFDAGKLAGERELRNKVIEEVLDIVNHPFETTDADIIISYINAKVEALKK